MYRSYFRRRNIRYHRLLPWNEVNEPPCGIKLRVCPPFAMQRLGAACMILGLTLALINIAHPQRAYAAGPEAPFGDKVGRSFTNYDRIRPTIATAGLLKGGAVAELKPLGFVTVLDLRDPKEGTASEQADVESGGLRYFNIPVSEQVPTDEQVEAFTHIVEDQANQPILIHCSTANRVGAMWTLYQVRKGLPVAIALEEGRTIGLQTEREKAIRVRLGDTH
jgi:uncharacterized protein (TIGR01244 family)